MAACLYTYGGADFGEVRAVAEADAVLAKGHAAFRKQVAALNDGLALGPNPVHPVHIPCGGMTLPAYLIRRRVLRTRCGR